MHELDLPATREAAARLVADRQLQGLPARVSDPSALARIAGLLAVEPAASRQRKNRARPHARGSQEVAGVLITDRIPA